jgi:formylglycine-generating enzyme required for sulfatase activity|tara:strand:- start:2956 stop:4683 length:1728 start_codon:yes stop_codon:yes gene_type:complete
MAKIFISMKRLLALLLLIQAAGLDAAAPLNWTEHRRALLINTSKDKTHAPTIGKLQKALHAKGFIVTTLGNDPKTDGVNYEKWVRSMPTMGVGIVYYLGRLSTEKTADGKRVCYSLQLGGYRELPPARDPSLGRSQPEDKPWLSLDRLSQKLDRNVSRENMVVVDCLGFDDLAKTKLSQTDLHGGAARLSGSELFTSFYPGKSAFHPSKEEPQLGPKLAEALTANLKKGGPLTPRIKDLAYTVAPRSGRTYELKHEAARVCAPPDKIGEGRFAGDQWVDQNGFCFVWCPATTFKMGDAAFADAQPVEVTISKGYWIGKYEILGAESALFNSGGQKIGKGLFARVNDKKYNQRRVQHFSPPGIGSVDKVTEELDKWQKYLAKNSLVNKGWTYDYPTEAEWELAARAGTRAGYPSAIKDLGQYGNFADRNLYNDRKLVHYIYANREADDGYGMSFAPVGQFRPNAWGIHDMHGNLAELCSNLYTEQLIPGVDPNDQSSVKDKKGVWRNRISRGGSWCSPPQYLHVAFRNAFTGAGTPHVGLRLLLRQGPRVTRSKTEITKALQAKLDAEKKSKQKKE